MPIKKTYKKRKSLTCFLLFFAMLSLLMVKNPVHARGGQTIYVDPKEYHFSSETTVGTKFNVTVWVNSTTYPWELMMFQIYMTFNDTLINVTQFWGTVTEDWSIRVWPNQNLGDRDWDDLYVFKDSSGGAIGNPVYYHLGSGEGAVIVGDLIASDLNVSVPKKLCTIEFEIQIVPPEGTEWTSILDVNHPSPDTLLYDSIGLIPDTAKENGTYVIPEFPVTLLMILMVGTAFAAVFMKKLDLIRANKKI